MESDQSSVVGIVGLGLIGGAVARRLVQTGDPPVVFDIRDEAIRTATADGAEAASSSRDLAARCDVVLVCVQTDAQCLAAVTGPDGVLEGARPGTCVAIVATVSPTTIDEVATQARERDVDVADTPIAGRGMFSVEEGTMSALVGGDADIVERLRPTLERFASNIVSAGPLGCGAALKLAHNIVVYAGFEAMLESIELARAAGVRDGLVEAAAQASGALSDLAAFTLPYYRHFRDEPHMPSEDEALRIAAALLKKDLTDAVELGRAHGVRLPVAELLEHAGKHVFPATEDTA
jgi:3-hydroxyisobutyrate dehydrogenase-like beta-hydroxyacid dehydrogenase